MLGSILIALAAVSLSAPTSHAEKLIADGKITFPSGADELQEKFDRWILSCDIINNQKNCSISQRKMLENDETLIIVDIKPQTNPVNLQLTLPFGLLVSEGITYQIGENNIAKAEKIKTCFSTGCISTIKLDEDEIKALKKETSLIISGKIENKADGIKIAISTSGFSAAYNRSISLLQ